MPWSAVPPWYNEQLLHAWPSAYLENLALSALAATGGEQRSRSGGGDQRQGGNALNQLATSGHEKAPWVLAISNDGLNFQYRLTHQCLSVSRWHQFACRAQKGTYPGGHQFAGGQGNVHRLTAKKIENSDCFTHRNDQFFAVSFSLNRISPKARSIAAPTAHQRFSKTRPVRQDRALKVTTLLDTPWAYRLESPTNT